MVKVWGRNYEVVVLEEWINYGKVVRMISSPKHYEVTVSTFSNKRVSSVLSAGADADAE